MENNECSLLTGLQITPRVQGCWLSLNPSGHAIIAILIKSIPNVTYCVDALEKQIKMEGTDNVACIRANTRLEWVNSISRWLHTKN